MSPRNQSDKKGKIDTRKRLGKYLAQLRSEKKVSIRRVAEETGISDPFLYQIEKGEKSLTDPDYFRGLANFYGIKVEELLRLAGYLPPGNTDEVVQKGVDEICKDKTVNLDYSFFGKLTLQEKIEIIELYQDANQKAGNKK